MLNLTLLIHLPLDEFISKTTYHLYISISHVSFLCVRVRNALVRTDHDNRKPTTQYFRFHILKINTIQHTYTNNHFCLFQNSVNFLGSWKINPMDDPIYFFKFSSSHSIFLVLNIFTTLDSFIHRSSSSCIIYAVTVYIHLHLFCTI